MCIIIITSYLDSVTCYILVSESQKLYKSKYNIFIGKLLLFIEIEIVILSFTINKYHIH